MTELIAWSGLFLVAMGTLHICGQVIWYRWEQHESREAVAREMRLKRIMQANSESPRASGLKSERKAVS